MKLSIKKSILENSLNYISKAISNKTPLPVLTGIKFEVNNDFIILTSSNSDIAIESKIKVDKDIKIEETGKAVIPGKYFNDIIKKVDEDLIDITVTNKVHINIKTKKSDFNLNGFNINDYPEINFNQDQELQILKTTQKDLLDMINETAYAVATGENRPILTGVNISIKDSKMVFTATDSFRLAKKIIDVSSSAELNITVPGRSLKDLSSLISDKETDVEIFMNNNYITFVFEEFIFQSRLLEGTYPETSKLIPVENALKIKVNKNELMHAVERAVIVVKEFSKSYVKIVTNNDNVTLYSDSTEIGKLTETVRIIEKDGSDIKISFSSKYIIEALRALSSEVVELSFTGEIRPFIIKNEGDETNVQLILPIRTEF